MKNKTFKWFFAWAAALLVVITGICLTPALPGATGALHPVFKTMLKSGDYAGGSALIRQLSYLFGLGVIGIFAFCIVIGVRKKDPAKRRKMHRILLISFALYVMIYTFMVFSYREYQATEDPQFFGGFPIPTAWMLYGMWFAPILITLTYIIKFDDWILTREEEEKFHEIVAARRKREANNP